MKQIKVLYTPRRSVHSDVLELSRFEENGISDPTRTTVNLHPFLPSRCSVGCRWMGRGLLNYAWKSSGPSGQKRAKLCSKNTVGLYGHKCAKEALALHKERTTPCSKRYNKVRFAQVGEQCTSMCGVDTEKGQVIRGVFQLESCEGF